MPLIVHYRSPCTITHIRWSVLGRPYVDLRSLYQQSAISHILFLWKFDETKFMVYPSTVRHLTPTSHQKPMIFFLKIMSKIACLNNLGFLVKCAILRKSTFPRFFVVAIFSFWINVFKTFYLNQFYVKTF